MGAWCSPPAQLARGRLEYGPSLDEENRSRDHGIALAHLRSGPVLCQEYLSRVVVTGCPAFEWLRGGQWRAGAEAGRGGQAQRRAGAGSRTASAMPRQSLRSWASVTGISGRSSATRARSSSPVPPDTLSAKAATHPDRSSGEPASAGEKAVGRAGHRESIPCWAGRAEPRLEAARVVDCGAHTGVRRWGITDGGALLGAR